MQVWNEHNLVCDTDMFLYIMWYMGVYVAFWDLAYV